VTDSGEFFDGIGEDHLMDDLRLFYDRRCQAYIVTRETLPVNSNMREQGSLGDLIAFRSCQRLQRCKAALTRQAPLLHPLIFARSRPMQCCRPIANILQ